MEIWVDVKNTDGMYQVSTKGRVRSFKTGVAKLLKPRVSKDGYLRYAMRIAGEAVEFRAHRLVAEYFIPNKNNKPTVNHIDGDKTNNDVCNLEWADLHEQMQHAYAHGLKKPMRGVLQKRHCLEEEDVLNIRKIYKRRDPEYGMFALAKKYGVSVSTINKCIGKRSYRNV